MSCWSFIGGRSMVRFPGLCFWFAFAVQLVAGAATPRWADVQTDLDTYATKAQADWQVPGFSMAIYEQGQVTYINKGVQDNRGTTPVTEDTVFCIMSCSKVITVLTVHRLAEEGRLSLEDKVVDFFPWFALSDPAETQKVKVKHLLAHCIGLPPFSGDTLWYLDDSVREIFKKLSTVPLKSPVGERYGYQNMFVGLAGLLVEKVTGQPLNDVVHKLIFEPLDMSSSSYGPLPSGFLAWMKKLFHKDPRYDEKRRAVGHVHLDGKIQPTQSAEQYVLQGTSGVNSSTRDYVKLLACLANGGVIQFGPHKGQRLIAEKTWKWISSAQVKIPHVRSTNVQFPVRRILDGSFYYGNGMFGMDYGTKEQSHRVLYHMGSGTGWRSSWSVVPELQLGMVVFSNLGSVNTSLFPEVVMFRTLDTLLDQEPFPWHDDFYRNHLHYQQSVNEHFEAYVLGAPLDSEDIVGHYEHSFYGPADISFSKGRLWLSLRKRKVALEHLGGAVYKFRSHDLIQHYGDDEEGTLVLRQSKKKHSIKGFTIGLLREGEGIFKKLS